MAPNDFPSTLANFLQGKAFLTKAGLMANVLWDIVQSSRNPACVFEIVPGFEGEEQDYVWIFANEAYQSQFWNGIPKNLGKRLRQVQSGLDSEDFQRLTSLGVGQISDVPNIFIPMLERWFDCRVLRPSEETIAMVLTEITHARTDSQVPQDGHPGLYRALFEGGTAKLVLSPTLMVIDANSRALDYYGWTVTNLPYHHFADVFDGDGTVVPADLSGGEEVRVSLQWHRVASGQRRHVEVHSSRISVGQGWFYLIVVHDREAYGNLRLEASFDQETRSVEAHFFARPSTRSPHLEAFRSRYRRVAPVIDELVDSLATVGRSVSLKRGDLLVQLGESATLSAVSATGYFRTFLINESASEVTVGFFHPGQIVSSYYSMVKNLPSELSIEVLNDCEAFVMDSTAFYSVVLGDQRWFSVLFCLLQEGYFMKERREISLLTMTPRDRYEAFVAENPLLNLYLKRYQVASFLGVTPETLSRVRNGS